MKWVRIKYDGSKFIDDTGEEGDGFVGLSFIPQKQGKDEITISFPLGYHLSKEKSEWTNEITSLLTLLSQAALWVEDEFPQAALELRTGVYPWDAYRWLILDYGAHGLYREIETEYTREGKGKINWNKTIKTQKAWVSDGHPYYLDLIRRQIKLKDEDLITRIHRYCIQVSLHHLGWLYTNYDPDPEPLEKDMKKAFQSVVLDKMNHTFKERNRRLFEYMLKVLEFEEKAPGRLPAEFGTYCFEAVWEKMIDQVFGNVDKTDYFPRGRWHFEENDDDQDAEKEDWTSYSHLTPDTIMKTEDGLFILDAKYYKYGITGKTADLPATSSITKQIIYGEYAESQNSEMKGKIYNAFLIPYDGKTDSSINEMKYIGYAYDEWKKEKQKTEWASYDRIYTFLLDTRTLMQMSIGQEDKSQELRKLASRILEIKDR